MTKLEIPEINGITYSFESKLGQGGAATVFKVRSSGDGQLYALKRIEKGTGSRRRETRFRGEIEFGMTARHDHVVKIHAHVESSKHFYYVMDLYSMSLREVITKESDYQVLLDYLSQLCDGLAYVHREGVVHRDIKPENILVNTDSQRLVLADFGIAHFKDSTITQRNDLLANRNYQAPEQMMRGDAGLIGKPADIFSLGLIINEVFTKQNSRGAQHRRVGDIHPFLSDLDLLVERMMLQDETERIGIEAARDMLNLIRRQVDEKIEEIIPELRVSDGPTSEQPSGADLILERAGKDVLSAKYIFERTSQEKLSRYNLNYHCEIGYRVRTELYNACVQSKLYSICKAKFEYEGGGSWSEYDLQLVNSPIKESLLREFISIQNQYPLARNSTWTNLPSMAVHYFRFCKDYHCEELLESIHKTIADTGAGSLQGDLLDAPIIWIAHRVREYLKTDRFEVTPWNLQRVEFERLVSVNWDGTCLDDSSRTAAGTDLFDKPHDAESVTDILEAFANMWDASVGERVDGSYSVHFRSRTEYLRFREEALALAAPYYVFEADVLDLLQPVAEYDDLVAFIWEPDFAIRSALAKILGLRKISEIPAMPGPLSVSEENP